MIRYVIILLVLCGACKENNSLNYNDVISVIATQEKAWNDGNIDGFMIGYWHNDSMQFITKNGISYGWENTLNNYKRAYSTKDKMGMLNFSNLKFNKLAKELAQVTGLWRISYPKDTIGGHFSLIFSQFESGPKIIVDHTW